MNWVADNRPWLRRAAERWSPANPRPLVLRCWLNAPVACDGYDPLTIEGALQCAVVLRETGALPDDVFADCPLSAPAEDVDIRIPIVDTMIGRHRVANASIGWFSEDARATKRQNWKRADAECYAKPIVKVAEAATKTQMLLKATVTALHVDFYVNGDRARITELLSDVTHLGASRAGGLGELQGVEVLDGAAWWFLGPRKRLMRPLPVEALDLGYGDFDTRESSLRAPYWHARSRALCHVPMQTLGEPLTADGAAGRFFVTPHAVERFRERIPGKARLSYEQALGELISLSDRAHLVRQEDDGSEVWRVGRPTRLRMRVNRGYAGLPQVTTVMPAFDRLTARTVRDTR